MLWCERNCCVTGCAPISERFRPAVLGKKCAQRARLPFWTAVLLAALLAGCSTAHRPAENAPQTNDIPRTLLSALQGVKDKFAPDSHLAICSIDVIREGNRFFLRGDVDNAAAKEAAVAAAALTGLNVTDQIVLLPGKNLGDRVWGIATLSVVNVREKPGNPSEMGTQILMGDVFKVWKKENGWFLVQTADHYVGWAEAGGFVNCTREAVDRWNASPRLMVTAFEERILEQPAGAAPPVADVVMGGLVKRMGESGDWFKVELADGRGGFLPKKSAMDYTEWQATRKPTPENIEHTARSFLGRPYSWGGNSIRGMDCSGLTKLVFFLNGIQLDRNAAEQCNQGVAVPLDDGLKNLKKGDLLFFGQRAAPGAPEKIDHTGIYLGDRLFIQSSARVQISSLDKASPVADKQCIQSLLRARRILPEP
jgi:gamma-D-glutamyl-L-lysine dipeptidyl-peptidase